MIEPDVARAMWALRLLDSRQLPSIARDLLSGGYDSLSLRKMALAEPGPIANELFGDALDELGAGAQAERQAAMTYARWICERMLLGDLGSYQGAKEIWRMSVALVEHLVELDPFIYAASEYEDRPNDFPFFDVEVRRLALDFLELVRPLR